MKIEIDVNKIVEEIDVKKLVEENIASDILESSSLEDIVDDMLENEEVKNLISRKVFDIISVYISSDEFKEYIIEKFKDAIIESDILTDDKIIELVADFLKKSLMER